MRVVTANVLDRLDPWDLEFEVAGKVHPTRRPSVADLDLLSKFGKLASEQRGEEFIGSLFEDPRPDIGAMEYEELLLVAGVYTRYFETRVSKNSPAVVALIKAATATVSSTSTG